MTTTTNKIALLGASGYTGQEIIRILEGHPSLELMHCMTARPDHTPEPPALPCDRPQDPLNLELLRDVDGVFLCTPHGAAAELAVAALERGCKVVDLSADFRLKDAEVYATIYKQPHRAPELLPEAVYGLSEFHREEARTARLIANPGCYPTSILLPLLPLLQNGLVAEGTTIIADSKSGVSGAGKTPSDRSIYGAIAENFSAYGVGVHRHTPEIHQAAGTDRIVFVPHLLPMFRGMLSTIYVTLADSGDADAARGCLAERYEDEPFVTVFDRGQPETNRVRHTNQCHMAVAPAGAPTGAGGAEQIVITSVIDNLGKGAASQAIQNMNLMLGIPETAGLS